MRTRYYSFIVPFLMDGACSMMMVAAPLLAIRFGASALFLGMMSLSAQVIRLPFCVTMGGVSERVGRAKVILPATAVVFLGMLGLACSRNNTEVFIFYVIALMPIGAFYAPLQAMIGDHSPRGELTKNLSAFNIGWCAGSAIMGLVAGYLLVVSQPLPFIIPGAMSVMIFALVLRWSLSEKQRVAADDAAGSAGGEPGVLLLISRLGLFLFFFTNAIVRAIFPKLANSLGFDEGRTGVLVGMLLIGTAVGVSLAALGPWWKARLWPQVLSQITALIAAVVVYESSSPIIIGAAFLSTGVSLGIVYTTSLYYGIQSRKNIGRNTSTHNSIIATASIMASLSGGVTAEYISLRAPYVVIGGLAAACLAVTALLSANYRLGSSRSRP